MKIKLYWPNCKYINKQWTDCGMDSYWVECTYEEAEKWVFPYLSLEQLAESKRNWEPKDKDLKDIGFETDKLCFLISKDLRSIESFCWYYPYSGQWNAYCPFEEIKEVEINELKDVFRLTDIAKHKNTETPANSVKK